MPARKRAATTKAAAGKSKKAKQEEQSDDGGLKAAVEALKTADQGKRKTYVVDSHCTLGSAHVFQDYDCMLNKTNIGRNNNKYYVIQLLYCGCQYYVWTRWGRVGEKGMHALKNCGSNLDEAKKFFCKKFTDKTKNKWEDRANFEPQGKYTLIEVEEADELEMQDTASKLASLDGSDSEKKVKPSKLDKATQDLVKLILNEDMFKEQMTKFELDVKKMPLGKLSKAQIAKGFEALEDIENAIKSKTSKAQLSTLCSRFYTVIPHSFGRKVPPLIDDPEKLQAKKDMLLVLGDIEIAQSLQKEKKQQEKEQTEDGAVPHPLDVNYGLLKCQLESIKESSKEFKVIQKYIASSSPGAEKQLLHLWRMDREGEDKRFSAHKSIDNRRLLWHGTNIAVVAAILKTGLRIMPHSGGRVGRGIYLASEYAKSRGYVGCANDGRAVMFLNEAALGKEHHITRDDSSLMAAPAGYDCIIAKGRREPDPKLDTTLKMDGKDVVVPQGQPVQQNKYSNSSFWQSEYLVYKESQNRMRYMCLFKLR